MVRHHDVPGVRGIVLIKLLAQGNMMLFGHRLDADIIRTGLLPGFRCTDHREIRQLFHGPDRAPEQYIVSHPDTCFFPAVVMQAVFSGQFLHGAGKNPAVRIRHSHDLLFHWMASSFGTFRVVAAYLTVCSPIIAQIGPD